MKKYHENLINITKNGGAWGGYYYGVFSGLINTMNFKNCAEVGIGYGLHAKEILDNTNIEKLYLIDPSKSYTDGFSKDVNANGGFEELVKCIKNHLKPHSSRYKWFRKNSLDITNDEIPNESLDAIFIDGDHTFDAVYKDLFFYWKKG